MIEEIAEKKSVDFESQQEMWKKEINISTNPGKDASSGVRTDKDQLYTKLRLAFSMDGVTDD